MMTSDELRRLTDELIEWGNITPAIGVKLHEYSRGFDALAAENERLRKLDRIVGTCSICSTPIRYHESVTSGRNPGELCHALCECEFCNAALRQRVQELERDARRPGFEPIESGTIQKGDMVFNGDGRWLEIPMLIGQPIKAGNYAVCRPVRVANE